MNLLILSRNDKLRFAIRVVLALLFILAGVLHFTHTAFYRRIMPPYLPFHDALIYLSGLFEILGGAALLIPRFRRAAGYGLILLLLAVFPANVQMVIDDTIAGGAAFPPVLLWLRLGFQFVLIAVVWWCAKPDADTGR